MPDYPVPTEFGVNLASDFEYDEELKIYGSVELHGYPIPNSGWQDKIIDFKVLSK